MLEVAQDLFVVIIFATFIGLILSGLFFIFDKTGLRHYLLVWSPNQLIYKLLECNFCLAFHLTAIFIAGICVVHFNFWLLFVPLVTAVITSKLSQ